MEWRIEGEIIYIYEVDWDYEGEFEYEFADFYGELTLTSYFLNNSHEQLFEREGNACAACCCGTAFIPGAMMLGALVIFKRKNSFVTR